MPHRETLWAAPPSLIGHTAHCSSSPGCRCTGLDMHAHMPTVPMQPEAEDTAKRLKEREREGMEKKSGPEDYYLKADRLKSAAVILSSFLV